MRFEVGIEELELSSREIRLCTCVGEPDISGVSDKASSFPSLRSGTNSVGNRTRFEVVFALAVSVVSMLLAGTE